MDTRSQEVISKFWIGPMRVCYNNREFTDGLLPDKLAGTRSPWVYRNGGALAPPPVIVRTSYGGSGRDCVGHWDSGLSTGSYCDGCHSVFPYAKAGRGAISSGFITQFDCIYRIIVF
ncbi:hypothetical protein AVEN_164047-1 [Araneus ventricosus]|uniref:Uncharacterized protein n=1 Tax=Araneus ventricosus TaxID=182803 RepID=A0A4Y2KQX9_ARAVE|nr:hypothetical protein AVEN_47630-1 [Araneus ventricosus]GBN03760.1 hypothetical protein AVEN_164047-1 [Araneus ventricosus]